MRSLIRPVRFRVDPRAPLASGLWAAYLGAGPGSGLYRDSGLYRQDGALSGFSGAGNTPAERWGPSGFLRRAALRLDGSADLVTLNAGLSIPPSGMTVALWVNADTILGDGQRIWIVTKGSGAGYEWALQLNDLFLPGSVFTATRWQADGGADQHATSATSAAASTWYHVAAVFPGPASLPSIWVNGREDTSSTGGSAAPTSATSTVAEIGQRGDGASYPFGGRVADLMFWRRPLSAAELRALADPGNVLLSAGGSPLLVPESGLWRSKYSMAPPASGESTGTATGSGDAVAAGVLLASATATATGTGDAAGVGVLLAFSTGTADGAGDAVGAGVLLASATGTATGSGDAVGAGVLLTGGESVGSATGSGDAVAAGVLVVSSRGTATGTGAGVFHGVLLQVPFATFTVTAVLTVTVGFPDPTRGRVVPAPHRDPAGGSYYGPYYPHFYFAGSYFT